MKLKLLNKKLLMLLVCGIEVFIILLTGCDESFMLYDDPVDDYSINGIIDSRNENNFIRLKKIYQTEELPMKGKTTLVVSEDGGKMDSLHDTLIAGKEKYTIFNVPKKVMERGKSYRLTFLNDTLGLKWADIFYPNKINIGFSFRIIDNDAFPGLVQWYAYFTFNKQKTGAFLQRLFIEYETDVNGIKTKKVKQLPQKVGINSRKLSYYPWEYNIEDLDVSYPGLRRWSDLTETEATVTITYDGYNDLFVSLKNLEKNIEPEKIKILGMFFVIYQIDEKFYDNFLSDSYASSSIRIDQELNQSNIYGAGSANGFIGTITTDTLWGNMFSFYINKLKYIDGQKYGN